MIALGGPTLKLVLAFFCRHSGCSFNDSTGRAYTETSFPLRPQAGGAVSMIALGGPTLKRSGARPRRAGLRGFNDSTGRAYTETYAYL